MTTPAASRALVWTRFSLGRHLRKPGTWAWILGVAAVAAIIRVAGGSSSAVANLVVLYAVPLAALSYGTSAMREEIEDQTLTYIFTRPIDRAWVYAARVGAAIGVVSILGLAGALVSTSTVAGGMRTAVAAVGAAAAYTGLFALCGAVLKRPAAFGLIFGIAWESGLGSVPGFLSRLTLRTHLRNLADLSPSNVIVQQYWDPPAIVFSVLAIVGVALVAVFLGALLARRREFVITR